MIPTFFNLCKNIPKVSFLQDSVMVMMPSAFCFFSSLPTVSFLSYLWLFEQYRRTKFVMKFMIEKYNERLLKLEMILLNESPCLATTESMNELMAYGVEANYAFALLVAAAFGLDVEGSDRAFFQQWLLPCVKMCCIEDFESDDYFSQVTFPEVKEGRVELCYKKYDPFEAFPCGDMELRQDGRIVAPIGFFKQTFRYPAIQHDGREWMTLTPNEILTMRQSISNASGHVLVYGLGLGYYTFMVSQKSSVESVTVVDYDADIIRLFRSYLLPQFANAHKITVLENDAFGHARNCAFRRTDGEPFDSVFVDLWHDVSDGLPLYHRMKDLQPLASATTRFDYWIEPSMKCYEL